MSKQSQQTFFTNIKNDTPVVGLIRSKLVVARLACLNDEPNQAVSFINEAEAALKKGILSGLLKEQKP